MTKLDLEALNRKHNFKLKELRLKEELLHRWSMIIIWVAGAFVIGLCIGLAIVRG